MRFATLIREWLGSGINSDLNQRGMADYMRLEERIVYSAAPAGDLADLEIDLDDPSDDPSNDDDFMVHGGLDFNATDPPWHASERIQTQDEYLDASDVSLIAGLRPNHAAFQAELQHELVFVDTQTEHYEQLVDDLRADRPDTILDVVLIHAEADGVQQITDALNNYRDLDAIHVVSHGTGGTVELGGSDLNLRSLGAHASSIAAWGDALRTHGDILFYGCDLAATESGTELLESISELTRADVAASDDITGHASLGGDWLLEYAVGQVETEVVFSYSAQAAWESDLHIPNVDEMLVNFDPNQTIGDLQETSRDDGGRNANSAVATSLHTDNHVVVWTATNSVTGEDVYFQLFDWAGRAIGGAVRVNQTLAGNQDDAGVAMDADGNFVVVWETNEPGGQGNDIFARRFDSDGVALAGSAGNQFRVNTTESGDQENPDVDMNDAGQFVIGWEGKGLGSTQGAFIRIFDTDGTSTTPNEVLVNQGMATDGSSLGGISVGIDGSGKVVAAWDELDTTNVEIRRFDNSGTALPNEKILPNVIIIDTAFGPVPTNLDIEHADVDVREDGHIAVSASARLTGLDKSIIVLTYLPDLSNTVDIDLFDAPVNDSIIGDHVGSSVVFQDNDTVLVTWQGPSDASDVNDTQGVYGKILLSSYDSGSNETEVSDIAGNTEFTINQTIPGVQQFGSVASREEDNFIVVWSGVGPGDTNGVFMRQFGTANEPIAVEDAISTLETDSVTVDPLLNDWDPNGDAVTLDSVDFSGLIGLATLNADDTITYDPNGQFDQLLPGETATDQFSYEIADGIETATATVTITIDGVNTVPVMQLTGSVTTSPGDSVTITATDLRTDDVDHGPAQLTYTLDVAPQTANGAIKLNGVTISAGETFTQEDINNGLVTYEKTLGNSTADQIAVTATDALGASATGTLDLLSTPNLTLSGVVYEDVNGDSDLGDAVGIENALVSLYRDNGDGQIDAGDVLLQTTVTDANGFYSFAAGAGDFFVTVASDSLEPTLVNKYNAGFDRHDSWAVQTYGSEGALVADGLGGVRQLGPGGGAAYGGLHSEQSDVFTSEITDKQHVTGVVLGTTDVTDIDYGFSFNVVTNTLAGDTLDHDAENRTVQGSLRQFIQNANAIQGENDMRFVPVVAPNAGTWWRIDVTEILPSITDIDTSIDGRAYDFLDGQSVLSTNSVRVGYTGKVGTGNDGVADSGDEFELDGIDGPELEIVADLSANITAGIAVLADNTSVLRIAIHGFGDAVTSNGGNIVVGSSAFEASNTQIRQSIIGAAPNASAAELDAAVGANHYGIHFERASLSIVRNTVIVGAGGAGVKIDAGNNIALVNNEIRGNAWANHALDGIDMGSDVANLFISNNLIIGNFGGGIDGFHSTGGHQITGNSILNSGQGSSLEGYGLRIYGSDSVITRNIVRGNRGSGILVVGQQSGPGSPALRNEITRNSFGDNGGIAIDLIQGAHEVNVGDGIDGQDGYDSQSGNQSIDRAELLSVIADGTSYTLSFQAVWGSEMPDLEIYLASSPDPSDALNGQQYGEGQTYIGTATFDGTSYAISNPNGYTLDVNDRVTVLAIDSQGNTSEFSNVVEVDYVPVVLDETYTTPEDVPLNGDVSVNDSDPDGVVLAYAIVAPVAGVTLNTDGTFAFVPPANISGSFTFQYTATDQTGNSQLGEASIDVLPVNDEEILVTNKPLSLAEGGAKLITSQLLQTTDIDNASDELVYTVTKEPQSGELLLLPDLKQVSTFTQAQIDAGLVGYLHGGDETGSDSFDFQVDDGQGSFTLGTFQIAVEPVNDAPSVSAPNLQGVTENTPIFFSNANGNAILIDDVDASSSLVELTLIADNGKLRLAQSNGLTFLQGDGNNDVLIVVQGTLDDLQDALDGLRFRPLQGFLGLASIEVTLNDLGNSGTPGPLEATDTVLMEVFDKPKARNDKFQLIAGPTGVTESLIANDTLPAGTTAPTLVTVAEHGKVVIHSNGFFTYTPDATFVGTDHFTYELANGVAIDQANVTLIVAPVPTQPNPDPSTPSPEPAPGQPDTETGPPGDELAPPPVQPDEDTNTHEDNSNSGSNDGSDLDSPGESGDASSSISPGSVVSANNQSVRSNATSVSRHLADETRVETTSPSDRVFDTRTFEPSSTWGLFDIYVSPSGQQASTELDLFTADTGSWQVPTGLALTGGLSVGWVAWSLNSGYLIGSLLSTISPWTLVDPLPVLDTFGSKDRESTRDRNQDKNKDKDENETKDKLDEMID